MHPVSEIYILGVLILIFVLGCLPEIGMLCSRPKTDEEAKHEAQKTKERERRLLRLCGIGIVLISALLLVVWGLS